MSDYSQLKKRLNEEVKALESYTYEDKRDSEDARQFIDGVNWVLTYIIPEVEKKQ